MRYYLTLTLLLKLISLSTILQAQQWEQVSSLPNEFNRTHHSFAFGLDDIGYIVSGFTEMLARDEFYSYDPVTDSWTELEPFPGGARGFAIGDTWDGKAYFGFGIIGANSPGTGLANDLWVFDPFDMSWTELAPCPCLGRTHPAMVAQNGKIFVGMGGGIGGDMKDWWEYDIDSNTWSQKDDLPSLARHHPYQFGIGDYVYTGFGHGDGIFNNWFRYDIEGETWSEVASLPSQGRVAGTQFNYNGFGYVLSGEGDDHLSMETGEFWVYDPIVDAWEELPPHPDSSRWAPASFIINGEVYIIGGTKSNEYETEIYKFNLDSPILPTYEFSNSIVHIYPNPTKEIINVKVPKSQNYRTNLYDLKGRIISSTKNESVVEIHSLVHGIYIIEITDLDSGQRVIKKIIKEF